LLTRLLIFLCFG